MSDSANRSQFEAVGDEFRPDLLLEVRDRTRAADLRWILEIQIRHPHRNFGAFYEDLLIEDDELQSARPSGGG